MPLPQAKPARPKAAARYEVASAGSEPVVAAPASFGLASANAKPVRLAQSTRDGHADERIGERHHQRARLLAGTSRRRGLAAGQWFAPGRIRAAPRGSLVASAEPATDGKRHSLAADRSRR